MSICIDELQDSIVVKRVAAGAAHRAMHATFAPASPSLGAPAKYRRPDCPVYLGLWICAVCLRSGKDMRRSFCPWRA